MVNNDYDKVRSFSRLYMTLFRHRTCTYLHGRASGFLVLVSNGQVAAAALRDWAYYQYSVPARLGKGQGAKEIGHNLVRKRHKIGYTFMRERPKFGLVGD